MSAAPAFTAWNAARLAYEAHRGQVDKGGEPYILHPLRVAMAVGADAEAMIVALLHDALEDSPLRREDLERAGAPLVICDAVEAITRNEGETPDVYYQRVRANPLALKVKLADIADNLDERRLAALDAATADRLRRKYARAVHALLDGALPPTATSRGAGG